LDLEVQPAHGLDLAVVGLPQVAALDDAVHALDSTVATDPQGGREEQVFPQF
jgi:hypothetical protein